MRASLPTQAVVLDARWGAGGHVRENDVADAVECLRRIIKAPNVRGAGFRLGAIKLMLDQYWRERDAGHIPGAVDPYARMSDAELMQETKEAEALLVEGTRQ